MGNLNETEKWEENIYQLETSDPVLGGADGISNRAPRQLANRTKWLKKKTEEAAQSLAEHVRSRNHPDATLTAKGFTQLSSATNSTSETLAATPTLPAKFTDFGGHLIDGLINGIKNKWGSLKSSVTGMGDSISSWFKQCWADIQEAFNGGIAGTGKLLINWSPAGLLYKAFAAALKYLGVDLPAKFTDFGGHLVDGLINGIKNKWESLKSSVTGMGDSISGWFSEKLGIHSPSRVFMGFGDNIAQGAAIGLQRTTPLAALAGQRMASELLPRMPVSIQGPEIRDNTSGVRFSMPLPDINGFMSSAKNAIGAVINSLSSMPAIPLSTRASILPGQRLANEMTPDVPRIPSPEILAAGYSGRGAAATGGGTSGGIQVSFNPQFFLNGRETTAPAGLTGALNMSLHELEKMLERLLAQKQRKEYR